MQIPENTSPERLKLGVVGAGSWGTALANLLAEKGYKVELWAYEQEVKEQISGLRENRYFLPGLTLSNNILPSNDLGQVVANKDMIVTVVPSHLVREVSAEMANHVSGNTIIVSASKGIENQTHLTMTQVLGQTLPNLSTDCFAAISGPSFAKEVVKGMPTVVTVASKDTNVARFAQDVFAAPTFRVYTIDDVIGVEIGGAVKNVIAIASGIVDGLGFGLNTRAALITRGLTEMRRLGMVLGADPHTFAGLAGVGDLILTCTGNLSRNYTVGKKIGEGKKLTDILKEMRMVAEGVKTAKSVFNLSRKKGVEMPISHEVYQVLYNECSPSEAVYRLMTRTLKHELEGMT